jgi:GST-like protein
MWQAANFGPTLGYAHYFLTYNAGQAPFAETRFATDVARLYRTLDDRLTGREYVAGDFSIADIAIWPWVSRFARHKINLDDFPAVQRWYRQLGQRESFKRGYRVPFATSDVPGL